MWRRCARALRAKFQATSPKSCAERSRSIESNTVGAVTHDHAMRSIAEFMDAAGGQGRTFCRRTPRMPEIVQGGRSSGNLSRPETSPHRAGASAVLVRRAGSTEGSIKRCRRLLVRLSSGNSDFQWSSPSASHLIFGHFDSGGFDSQRSSSSAAHLYQDKVPKKDLIIQ